MARKVKTPKASPFASRNEDAAIFRQSLISMGLAAEDADRALAIGMTPASLYRATTAQIRDRLSPAAARAVDAARAFLALATDPLPSAGDAREAAIALYDREAHLGDVERFHVVSLNSRMRVIAVDETSIGGIGSVAVDVPTVLRIALARMASAIIVAHNHPSGDCAPSEADDVITRKIANGALAIGLSCVDHLILTPQRRSYSYATVGRIL